MLACVRLGAIHSVVFGGFAANELATRIEDAKPKVIVSASCGIEPGRLVEYKPLVGAAIAMVESKPRRCVVLQRPMLEAELIPAMSIGRLRTSAGPLATPTPSTRPCSTAVRPSCTKANPLGRRMPAPSGA